jgi:ferredoxin
MRVEVDQSKCTGHARCFATAEDLFPLDDDGYTATSGFDVPADREDDARLGATVCPEQAITVVP